MPLLHRRVKRALEVTVDLVAVLVLLVIGLAMLHRLAVIAGVTTLEARATQEAPALVIK